MFTEKKKFSESILPDLTFLSRHLWCAGGGWRLDQHDHPQCGDQPGHPRHLQAPVQPAQPEGEDQLRGDHPDQEQGGLVPVLGHLPLHHLAITSPGNQGQSGDLSLVLTVQILRSDWCCYASSPNLLRHSSRHPKHPMH